MNTNAEAQRTMCPHLPPMLRNSRAGGMQEIVNPTCQGNGCAAWDWLDPTEAGAGRRGYCLKNALRPLEVEAAMRARVSMIDFGAKP